MPYDLEKPETWPDTIRLLPPHAKEIWIKSYNSAYEQYGGDEAKANAVAWSAVKNDYEKNAEDEWVIKNSVFSLNKEVSGIPSEIQVIPFGSHKTDKGNFSLDEESAEAIIEDFNSRQNDMVIDYEHQTLSGKEAPAAGWIKRLVNKGKEGIWAAVEWTEKAKEYFKNREYRYLSPVFLKRLSDNRVIRLINAGLTNQPAIDGMVPVVNKQSVIPAEAGIQKEKEVSMKKLLELLGLAETATEDEAVSALQALLDKLKEEPVASKDVLSALGLKEDATASEITGTIMALTQGHGQTEGLSKKVSELSAKLRKRDADELVALAMKEGKVTPAQNDWAQKYAETDLEGFRVFISKAPVVVQTGEIAGGGKPGDGVSMDAAQIVINKALGVSDETFKKYAQKEG